MKRALILLFPLLFVGAPLLAQDTAGNAAAIAAKQEADERYKQVAADLQTMQADNQALHAKIDALEQTVQSLRDAQAKPADNSAVQDELRKLAEKIQEVDKKRLEDKDAISEEIRKSIGGLQSSLGGSGAVSLRPPKPPKGAAHDHPVATADGNPTPPAAPVDGYSYTIQDGDTLGAIIKAYNTDFKSKGLKTISMKQAREANPNVDWNRLLVGQKIVIPRPPGG